MRTPRVIAAHTCTAVLLAGAAGTLALQPATTPGPAPNPAGPSAPAPLVPPGPPLEPWRTLPDATFALRIDDGSSWRRHAPTARMVSTLTALGAAAAAKNAWSELAGTLGMEDGPAFDELLGRTLVYASSRGGAWGIMGGVSPEVGRTLETKLDPAPRGFEDGRAVMLVERGRFRLTRMPAEPGALPGAGVRMVLTPGESAPPIEMTAHAAAALAPPAGIAGAGDRRRAAWFWRPGDAALTGTVAAEENGWSVRFGGEPGALGLTAEACRKAALTGEGDEPGADVGLLEVAARIPGRVPGIRAETKALSALLAAAKVRVPPPELIGDGIVIRAEAGPGGARNAGPEPALAGRAGAAERSAGGLIAVEVTDVRAAAPAFDAMMVGVLELAWRLSSAGQDPSPRDFRREIERAKDDPSAVRLVLLAGEPANGAANPRGGPRGAAPGPGEGGTLAWTCVRGSGAGGWWVAQFVPGPADGDRAERVLREGGARIAARRWGRVLIAASVRPAELSRTWDLSGLTAEAPWLSAMSDLERVTLTVRAAEAGLEGEGRATVTPDPRPR